MKRLVSKLLLFVMLTSLLLSGCKKNQQEGKQPELLTPVNVTDKTEMAEYRDISSMDNAQTTVVPHSEIVFFATDGTFGEFHVAIGEKVKKGQKLASYSVTQYQNELKDLKKTYEETKSSYDNEKKANKLDLEINKASLAKEESNLKTVPSDAVTGVKYRIDRLKLEQKSIQHIATLKYREYQEQLSNIESKMDILKDKMKSNSIVAPFNGVVTSIASDIKQGDNINAYFPIAQLVDESRLHAYFNNDLEYAAFKAERFYAIINSKEYEVKESDEFVLPVKHNEDDLKPGDMGVLCMQFNYRKHVLSVTNKAVYTEGEDLHYVYRMMDGKKEKVPVKLGAITDIYTEIVGGLEEGDVVYSD